MGKKPQNHQKFTASYTDRAVLHPDRSFQLKYTKWIIFVSLVTTLLFVLPSLYFVNQNYNIFLRFSDSISPSLSHYLSREKFGFNLVFVGLFCVHLLVWVYFSRKLALRLIGPIKILRNHLKLVSRGYFSIDPIKIRENDEFKDLVHTYNYFYTLLKVQNEQELLKLKKIRDNMSPSVAKELITQMIDERESRAS